MTAVTAANVLGLSRRQLDPDGLVEAGFGKLG